MSSQNKPNPTLEVLRQLFFNVVTYEGRQKTASFVPRPTDVFVATYPKCGTTWMQQIMHQLRSGGDMSYRDITEVVPWIDVAYRSGNEFDIEQKYQPRCFKTHTWYEMCPKGAKYVVVYREPCAAFYSLFKFFEGHHFQPGEITLDECVKTLCLFPSEKALVNYFDQLLSWWPRRHDPNVLCLLYEDMLEDLESAVRAVASFIGIDDEASTTNAVKMSTFDFMKQNQEKFATQSAARHLGLPLMQRVQTGSATKGREMMEEHTKQAVQKMWNDIVTKETGFQDYNELRDALKKEKQSR